MDRTVDQMMGDLSVAHEAGNKELAQRIADAIRAKQSAPAPAAPKPVAGPDLSPEALAQDNLDQIKLRLPEIGGFGGQEIPLVPKAVSRALVGNTAQFTDLLLGGAQGASKLFGSKDMDAKLAEIARGKNVADEALDKDTAAKVGSIGGRLALTVPATMATGAGAGAMLPSVLKSMAVGGVEGALKSGEDYSPVKNAAIGAGAGALGDVGGRALTRVISPALGAKNKIIQRELEQLKDVGKNFPHAVPAGTTTPLVAKNLTDSRIVQGLSDVMEKIPGMGGGIKAAEEGQERLLTRLATTEAGTPMEEVGAHAAHDIMTRPNAMANAIRAQQTPIPIPKVPNEVQAAIDAAKLSTGLSGKAESKMLPNILEAASTSPTVRMPNGTQVGSMSPNEFMTARAALSDAGHGASGVAQETAKAGQGALERAYMEHAGPQSAADFLKWKKMHGLSSDIARAAEMGGVGAKPLQAHHMAAVLEPAERRMPTTDLNKFITALAARGKKAPNSDWRQMAGNLVLGTSVPVLGGLAGEVAQGHPGGAVGAVAAPALAMALLGTQRGGKYLGNQALTPEMKAMIQQLLTSGAISTTR